MGRWEPDTENRFRAAALELFGEIGYEHTTVAAIAQRAGLTSRTFFRYFADKPEVLFNGSERLQETLVTALLAVPPEAAPIDAVSAALTAAGDFFDDARRPFARLRNAVIATNPALHERELIKLATLSAALAAALQKRNVDAQDASLLAQAAIAVFQSAFSTWVAESERRSYAEIVVDALARLRRLTGQ